LRDLLVERRFSVEFLMAVAAVGAVYLEYLFEGLTVLMLFSLAEYFEGYIEDRARKTAERLSAYMPDKARIIENGSELLREVGRILPGMVMLIKPGERIPLDGFVTEGSSNIDQAIVTGEDTPVFKCSGDETYAGTLNLDGVLRVEVIKGAESTLVSRIVALVIQSRKRKASIERLVDRFARVYVPVVLFLAFFTALVMPIIAGGQSQIWLYRSLIFLVISCPSAFVVSVPAAFFTAITTLATKGVMVKGGVYIEKMDKVKAVLFDKTGTLTQGSPKLVVECPVSLPTSSKFLRMLQLWNNILAIRWRKS
jgi:Cd2+/Zn2+-exporting ATPase